MTKPISVQSPPARPKRGLQDLPPETQAGIFAGCDSLDTAEDFEQALFARHTPLLWEALLAAQAPGLRSLVQEPGSRAFSHPLEPAVLAALPEVDTLQAADFLSAFAPGRSLTEQTLERSLVAWCAGAPADAAPAYDRIALTLRQMWRKPRTHVRLDMQGVTSLPMALAHFPLTHLILDDCAALADFAALTRLQRLRSLTLDGCTRLRGIPAEVFALPHLRTLILSRCYALVAIAPAVRKLQALETLVLNEARALGALPPQLALLPRLRRLELLGCVALERIPPCVRERFARLRVHITGAPGGASGL